MPIVARICRDPRHYFIGQTIHRGDTEFEMFLFRILDLVMTDPVQTLHEHHHRGNAHAGHFSGIMQGTGR